MLTAIVNEIIENVNDTLADAHVSEPAGRGCGYGIEYDEQGLRVIIGGILQKHGIPNTTKGD